MSSSSSELAGWSREALVNHILDLEVENAALSRRLRHSTRVSARASLLADSNSNATNAMSHARTSGSRGEGVSHADPQDVAPSSPGSHAIGTPISPAVMRMSASLNRPRRKAYEISMSVVVIENGSTLSVPMSSVLDKTYGREDVRDADTPVVASKYLHDVESMRTQRFSISSDCRNEQSPSMDLGPELNAAHGDDSSAALNDGAVTRQSLCLSRQPGSDDQSDEPHPRDPSLGGPSHASLTLAQRAGVTRLNLKDRHFYSPDLHLDADALLSRHTLSVFRERFNFGYNALSPLSSSGNAVYHYIVKTFAVRNGCQHSPDDVEGFGRTMINLCREVKDILQSEPRHSSIASPCYVFGDLHGNFRDLFYFMDNLISFQDLRYTPHRFVFLGDYVDRGEFSIEVVAYLFSMKVLAPNKVLLLRGNHEDTLVCGDISGYGCTSFRAQCHAVFGTSLGEEVWHSASGAFSHLPLTANIDGCIYCTHGGIPRYRGGADDRLSLLQSEDFPAMLSFFTVPEGETPQQQTYRQLGMDSCWADPAENESHLDQWGFGANPRGTGVILFGSKAVDDFLEHHGFDYIFRAHQEKSDGLKLSKSARVVTIFSTSAYVGHQNGAGVVLVADGKIRLLIKCADTYEEETWDEGNEVVDSVTA